MSGAKLTKGGRINLRITPDEKEMIRLRAAKLGMGISEFLLYSARKVGNMSLEDIYGKGNENG